MLYNFTPEELRAYCRTCIESLELWSRRLIHEKMTTEYGDKYFEIIGLEKNIISNSMQTKVSGKMKADPDRFRRMVDALFIDDIIYFLLHPAFYKSLFKEALDYPYPQGRDEAREFLSRIIPIRNTLSHANPISVRQAEQAICYSNDFIDGLKQYYDAKGAAKMWNVPTIINVQDSNGYSLPPKEYSKVKLPPLRPGDQFKVTVTVDPSFNREEYRIVWLTNDETHENVFDNCDSFHIKLKTSDIGERFSVACEIISNKDWHRLRNCDDWLRFTFPVLPPVE